MTEPGCIRNLIFHAYPRDNEMLGINLEYLAKYIHLFNGAKVINIVRGTGLLSPDEFISLLESKQISTDKIIFTLSENSPLGETEPFIEKLLPAVRSLERNQITFYCHTKGVSKSTFDIPRIWAKLMWEHNLEDIDNVDRVLRQYPCCGVLKKGPGTIQDLKVPWHFSGTFFWFKNYQLFSKDWHQIDNHRCGVEAYLAKYFPSESAHCLKYELKPKHGDTRRLMTWKSILQDEDYR